MSPALGYRHRAVALGHSPVRKGKCRCDIANRAIRKIAETGGYDIVVQDAYYASPRVDITDQVLKELASPTPAAANK